MAATCHMHAVTVVILLRPQRARIVLVLCVCLDSYSRTTGYEAAYERLYQQLQCYKGMKINLGILLKRLRSRDMT